MDQSPAPEGSGLLVNEGVDLGLAAAHRLRRSAVPQPVGMLESRHGHFHDRR